MSIANMPIKNTEGDLFGYQDSCGYRWFNVPRVKLNCQYKQKGLENE